MTIRKEIGIDRKGRPYITTKDMTPGVGTGHDTYMESTKYYDSVPEAEVEYNKIRVYSEAQVRATVRQYQTTK
jgi:hypothetical protein